MTITLRFNFRDTGFRTTRLLEKIQVATRQVESEPDNNNTRYQIFLESVLFDESLTPALGKLIALLCKTDVDKHGTTCCKIAQLKIYGCFGFTAAVVPVLFPPMPNGNIMMECLDVSFRHMSELNIFLAQVPKHVRIANVWKIRSPLQKFSIVPVDAQVFAHHLAQVQGVSQLYLTGFNDADQEHPIHPVLLLASRIASWPLKALHLVDCFLDDAKAARLIRFISGQSMRDSITSFALTNCYLREEAFATLGEWLAHPDCRLQSLDLSFPSHRYRTETFWPFYHPFFEIMVRQGTIKHLDMSNIWFGDVFAPDIARVLLQNTSLECCKFDLHFFGRDDMKTVTNALKQAGENLRSVQLLKYGEMLQGGWTGMFLDTLKANPRLVSMTCSDPEAEDEDEDEHEGDALPSSPDTPSLIQEFHYYLSLNKAGRPYFYLFEGTETPSPPVTMSPLPLALWPHLLARAARIDTEGASTGDLIYRMLQDGPLVQELRNLRASRRSSISRK